MLQTMRNNAQGIIAKIIVFFIIVVFALWGVESIVNLGGGEEPVAVVDGSEVQEVEVLRLIEQRKSSLRRQFGDQFDESLFSDDMLRRDAVEQLIEQKVASSVADRFGVFASSEQVDEAIVSIPAFQQDGRFDKEQFLSLLRLNGWSPMGFRQSMEDDLKVVQVNQAMFLSSAPLSYQAKIQSSLMQEEREIFYQIVSEENLLTEVELEEGEAQAFYEENQSSYMAPETVKVRYVGLEREKLAEGVEVSDEEIQAAYEDYLEQSRDGEQRQASHILVEVGDARDDASANELVLELEQRIKAGEDFSELAQQYSDDIGTKESGGDLGLVGKGAFVPEFEQSLFALKVGEVSAPVKTEFGYHIIKLENVVEAEVDSLADKEEELVDWIRSEKAGAVIAEQSQELANLAFTARSVDEIAETLGLEVHETAQFTRSEGEGLASNSRIRESAFADNLLFDGELSELIETEEGSFVVAVSEHTEAAPIPFDVVKAAVEAQLKQKKAAELAEARAVELLSSDDKTAGNWMKETLVFSGQSELPRALVAKAFELPKGDTAVVAVPGGYAALSVGSVNRAESVAIDDGVMDSESSRMVRAATLSYRSWAKANTEIESSLN